MKPWLVPALLAPCLVSCGAPGGKPAGSESRPLEVAVWMPTTWDYRRALAALEANADIISSVSPIWYRLSREGAIERRTEYAPESGVPLEVAMREVGELCRRRNIRLIPLISNAVFGKGFDAGVVSAILNDPDRRGKHIQDLVALTVDGGYAGIEIDYELLKAADRDAFSLFMADLARALHGKAKLLATAIHAKVSEPGDDWGSSAHDYTAVSAAADSVRIMAYDYHWATGPAGPLAPLPWYREVLACAVREIPREKLLMGLPTYGYDWTGQKTGKSVSVLAWAMPERARELDVEILWDRESHSPYFTYKQGSDTHQVWYEDVRCLAPKVAAAREAGIAGIAVFRLGSESDEFWKTLREIRK